MNFGKIYDDLLALRAGFDLLLLIIDQCYQNELSEFLFSWEEEITCCSASKTHTEKTVTQVN